MTQRRGKLTWQDASKAAGFIVLFVVLASYTITSMQGKHLDVPIALTLLAIAAGLLGVPSGYVIVKRHEPNGE